MPFNAFKSKNKNKIELRVKENRDSSQKQMNALLLKKKPVHFLLRLRVTDE
jgi:hypothetical protein